MGKHRFYIAIMSLLSVISLSYLIFYETIKVDKIQLFTFPYVPIRVYGMMPIFALSVSAIASYIFIRLTKSSISHSFRKVCQFVALGFVFLYIIGVAAGFASVYVAVLFVRFCVKYPVIFAVSGLLLTIGLTNYKQMKG